MTDYDPRFDAAHYQDGRDLHQVSDDDFLMKLPAPTGSRAWVVLGVTAAVWTVAIAGLVWLVQAMKGMT